MKRFIYIIIILCVALGAIGFWYWQRNPYSKDILKLEIIGPGETDLSEEVEYTVRFKNNGNVRLENPLLIFEFPQYTLLPEGESLRQEITKEELGGAIYPGQEKTFQFKGRLFGKKDDIKTAKAWLTYQPKNLNATYESSTTLNTLIKSVPLTFSLDLPSKVESDREFSFSLNYFSSLDYPLTDLAAKIEYPSGFEFLKSTPNSLGKKEWELSVLNMAEGGRVEISGKLSGEPGSQKIFKASLGVWRDGEFVLLKEISKGTEIGETNLSVFQRINNQDDYVASPGELLHYEVFFRNISENPFNDLFLVVKLSGQPFDFDSVRVSDGKFSKGDNSIIWDWRNVSKLRFLDQGEEGRVEFWIELKEDWGVFGEENFTIRNQVLVSQMKAEFETKVNSKLTVSQKGYYQDEIFGSSGPLPPQVGEETEYTIVWEASNYYNDLKNVRMKAKLPNNVELTGKIFPEGEKDNFTFDMASREIVWRVLGGQIMDAGKGILDPAPRIAFQITLNPYSSQRGRTAEIIRDVTIQGEDQWTDELVTARSSGINTSLPDDPTVTGSKGIVE